MKTVKCISVLETGFANGVPQIITPDDVSDALETEIRFSMIGHNTAALQAMKKIIEKKDGDK